MTTDQLTLDQLREWKKWFDKLTFEEKVLESRKMSMSEKMLLGGRLFDLEREDAYQEIRVRSPEFTEEQVKEEFRRSLAEQHRIDEEGIYQDAGMLGEND
ncbi:MAG: hypothetical protein ACKVP0_14805 [Pirellulaceae bacterium]